MDVTKSVIRELKLAIEARKKETEVETPKRSNVHVCQDSSLKIEVSDSRDLYIRTSKQNEHNFEQQENTFHEGNFQERSVTLSSAEINLIFKMELERALLNRKTEPYACITDRHCAGGN